MTEISSQVEKLDKGNYQPWKFHMRNYLIGKEMWGFVTGATEQPRVPDESSTKAEIDAYNQWNTKDKMVTFILSQNISNSMI